MHELGVTRRILEVALERAAEVNATRITMLHIEVGELSGISPDSVEFYWPEVSRATPADGARLVFSTADDPSAFRMTAIDVADAPGSG
jgi:Zn finger protein HypA/HybF involved in hydrogenase expression